MKLIQSITSGPQKKVSETIAAGKEAKIDLALISKLADDEEHKVNKNEVQDVINTAHESADDEVECATFGLETDDGEIVKVHVNKDDADKFEVAMSQMLGSEDSIEDAIDKLAKDFDIVAVDWPRNDEEDKDDEQGGLADLDIELNTEISGNAKSDSDLTTNDEPEEEVEENLSPISRAFLLRMLGEAKKDEDEEPEEDERELPQLSGECERVMKTYNFPRYLTRLILNTILLTGFPPSVLMRNTGSTRKAFINITNEINKNARAKIWLKQFNAVLGETPLYVTEELSESAVKTDPKDGLVMLKNDAMSSRLYDLILALGVPESSLSYLRSALKVYFRNTALAISKSSRLKTRFNLLYKVLVGKSSEGNRNAFDAKSNEIVGESFIRESANYHSIFVKGKDGKWIHHFDADDKVDARDEMDSLRNNGEKPISLVVPKAEATWAKGGEYINDYVEKRLAAKGKKVQEELDDKKPFSRLTEMARRGRPPKAKPTEVNLGPDEEELEAEDEAAAVIAKGDKDIVQTKELKNIKATDLGEWNISNVGDSVVMTAGKFSIKFKVDDMENLVDAIGENKPITVKGWGKKITFVPYKLKSKNVYAVKQSNDEKFPNGVLISDKSVDAILDYQFEH